ncbi:MAG: radical SAM family heme chaperone HemW [Bacteroidales bacterium]|jgi:oxygen-independent coproporphyrinogen-3 oxidase|nr:radical SAM family heme chaperone HemW [Bacteroidales bacterium]
MAGFYVHVPYCRQVCYYCDFHFRAALKDKPEMLMAMRKEMGLRKDYLSSPVVHTLYFGGGTPSALSIADLSALLDTFHRRYSLSSGAEVTLEANPDDLTGEYLSGLRGLGFNRLSIGIQSFDDNCLRWMNRRHTAQEAIRAVKKAQDNGFDNINIDLIYGIPAMSVSQWERHLKTALSLDVPHLSTYHLTIESRTVFGKRKNRGEDFSVPERESVAQFDLLSNICEKAGYEHYEISNFARPGLYSRHNTAYWRQIPYIGIGPSAHSYDGTSRQWNVSHNAQYIEQLLHGHEKWYEREILTVSESYNDYVLTSLRTMWGTDAAVVHKKFGKTFAEYFVRKAAPYLRQGYMNEQTAVYTLSHKGKLIADRIASDLFVV